MNEKTTTGITLPSRYIPAEWRCTTAIDKGENALGLSFDSEGKVIYLKLNIESAISVQQSLTQMLSLGDSTKAQYESAKAKRMLALSNGIKAITELHKLLPIHLTGPGERSAQLFSTGELLAHQLLMETTNN